MKKGSAREKGGGFNDRKKRYEYPSKILG